MSGIEIAGKIAWLLMIPTWYILRYPFQRRVKRLQISDNRMNRVELTRLWISGFGLGGPPLYYVVFDGPRFADYPPSAWLLSAGIVAAIASLTMFRLTHKALGKMWSISLQLKQDHKLITTGVYRWLRHPMYTAFWLMAVAQALLLPNWVAGLSGLLGFGTLFFLRIGPEEAMMEQAFGDEYRAYKARTKRIIPLVY